MAEVLQTGQAIQSTVPHTPTCLAGWCEVGSLVLSNFYMEEAERPREVERVHLYPGKHPSACVWTKEGPGVRVLNGVDFDMWIKKPPQ